MWCLAGTISSAKAPLKDDEIQFCSRYALITATQTCVYACDSCIQWGVNVPTRLSKLWMAPMHNPSHTYIDTLTHTEDAQPQGMSGSLV